MPPIHSLAAFLTRPVGYRGYYQVCAWLARGVPPEEKARVVLPSGGVFAFYRADPYWNRLLSRFYSYEPEVAAVLKKISDIPYTFLDLGANAGYWSVYAAAAGKKTLAVDASTRNMVLLRDNAAANGFDAVHAAIVGAASQKTATLYSHPHDMSGASSSLQRRAAPSLAETVPATTIDDLVRDHGLAAPLVLKLDIEGGELDALNGATQTRRHDTLLILEDHAFDRASRVTAGALAAGLVVYFRRGRKMLRIDSAKSLTAHKSRRNIGYNIFATQRGSVFAARLEMLC